MLDGVEGVVTGFWTCPRSVGGLPDVGVDADAEVGVVEESASEATPLGLNTPGREGNVGLIENERG